MRTGRIAFVALAMAVVSAGGAPALAAAAGAVPTPVDAAGSTLRIEPAALEVPEGATFEVRVVQAAAEATSGTQVSVDFDPGILEVSALAFGPAHASAPVVVPELLGDAIPRANATGHLAQVAAAFLPPAVVPAGEVTFLTIEFRVIGCGESQLALPSGGANAQMISGEAARYGAAIPVTTEGASVTTCTGTTPAALAPASTTARGGVAGRVGPGVPWFRVAGGLAIAGTLIALVAILTASGRRARRRRSS